MMTLSEGDGLEYITTKTLPSVAGGFRVRDGTGGHRVEQRAARRVVERVDALEPQVAELWRLVRAARRNAAYDGANLRRRSEPAATGTPSEGRAASASGSYPSMALPLPFPFVNGLDGRVPGGADSREAQVTSGFVRHPGRLAQLGERQLDKLEVTGSIPVRPPRKGPGNGAFSFASGGRVVRVRGFGNRFGNASRPRACRSELGGARRSACEGRGRVK